MKLVLGTYGLDVSHFKDFIEHAVGFQPDSLHVLVGVLLHLALAALLRSSLARPAPWLILLAIELANEANDLSLEIWPGALAAQWGESMKDIILTMLLPTVLLVAARWKPDWLTARR